MDVAIFIIWVAVHLGILLLMLLVSGGLGHIFLRRFNFYSTFERLVFTTSLGLGLCALLIFILGLLGLLYRELLWALTAAGALGTIVYLLVAHKAGQFLNPQVWKKQFASQDKVTILISLAAGGYWGLLLLTTQYPPHHWDAISHHLVLSREYVEQHRVVAVMGIHFPVLPSLNHMLFSWALALKDDVLAQMVEHTFLMLTAAGLYTWGSRQKRRVFGLALAAFWLGSPLVLWLGEAAYVDICLASYVFLGLYSLRLFWDSSQAKWWYLSAVLLAMAAGVKATGLFFLMAGAAFGLWAFLRWSLLSGIKRGDSLETEFTKPFFTPRSLISGWAMGALVVLPWYLFIFSHTGNPLWPTFPEYSSGVWGSPEVVKSVNAWLKNAGQTSTLRNFFMLSIDWINHPARFQAENNLSLFPLIAAWPLTWIAALWNRSVRWWAFWALAFTLFWFQHPQLLRYWLPALPFAIIALYESIRWAIESSWKKAVFHRVIWIVLIFAAAGWGGISIARELRTKRLPPTNQQQREAFVSMLGGYRAVNYLNRQADKDDTVCVINASYLNYYLKSRKLDLFGLLYAPKLPKFRWPDDEQWVKWMETQNAEWILINHANAPSYLALPKQNLVLNPFWPDYELVYSDPATWVFRYKQDKIDNIVENPVSPPIYEGYHDITNCNGIMGWAWDKSRPDEPVKVDIYDGDLLLITITASDFRQDLLNAGIGNGHHGFTYPVPPELKDGKPHSIRMRFAGTDTDLNNTPKEVTCTFEH